MSISVIYLSTGSDFQKNHHIIEINSSKAHILYGLQKKVLFEYVNVIFVCTSLRKITSNYTIDLPIWGLITMYTQCYL